MKFRLLLQDFVGFLQRLLVVSGVKPVIDGPESPLRDLALRRVLGHRDEEDEREGDEVSGDKGHEKKI